MTDEKLAKEVLLEKKENPIHEVWHHMPHMSSAQLRSLLVTCWGSFHIGIVMMFPNMSQLKPPFRCHSSFDDLNSNASFAEMREMSLYCQKEDPFPTSCKTCDQKQNATRDFFPSVSASCEQFVYDRGDYSPFTSFRNGQWESIVTDLDLVCHRGWMNTVLTCCTFVGFMLGSILGGNYTDNYGRKNAITLFSLLLGVALIVHGFMPAKFEVFAIFRIIESVFLYSCWIAILAWSAEVFGPSQRHLACIIQHIAFNIGWMTLSVIGYTVPDWRDAHVVNGIIVLVMVLLSPLYPESPIFLISKGKFAEGKEIIQHWGRSSKTTLTDSFWDYYENSIRGYYVNTPDKAQYSSLDLFRHGNLTIVTIVSTTCTSLVCAIYYGLSYNAAKLPGSVYVNNAINGLLPIFGYIICTFLMKRMGRVKLNSIMILSCGLACLLSMTLRLMGYLELSRWTAFAGQLAICSVFCMVYAQLAELFPTTVRGIGTGFNTMISQIVTFIVFFIISVQNVPGFEYVPMLLFGLGGLMAGSLLWLLPETRKQPTLQTIQDANDFYKKHFDQMPKIIIVKCQK